MTKARREIAASIRTQDVVIEVLDARMPRASENPLLAELRGPKPCIKVLAKSDLADPAVTQAWLRYFERERSEPTSERPQGRVVAIALTTDKLAEARKKIPELCHLLTTKAASPSHALRAMVVGIPNVGKSTLINTLMQRTVAKASDKPAVTKSQQLAVLKGGIVLQDNPGIMWPNVADPRAGLRLAMAGSIPDTAIDYEVVALFAAKILLSLVPKVLTERYKLASLPETPADLLRDVGKHRGRLRKGGIVDIHAAAEILIHDFRSGALGRISLEMPPVARTVRSEIPLGEIALVGQPTTDGLRSEPEPPPEAVSYEPLMEDG